MSSVKIYKPSWRNIRKYGIYIRYFIEYLKNRDFKSLLVAINYVFFHRLPKHDYETKSELGRFRIRKSSTDFQFINYAYEKSIKDYLKRNLGSFDVFIDLGACIGEYCIWLAKEGKNCIAVEPVNYKAVLNNVAINKLEDKIKVFACGVGDKKERAFFYIPDGVTSSSHIDNDSGNEPNAEIDTLDNIMKAVSIPVSSRVVIKLDVEGMEVEAINGAKQFISNCQNLRVIYEHFIEDNYRNDRSLLEICDFSFENLDDVNRIATKKV
ncbi:MAG: FkbM family methyltransferase [Chitinophagaceae bacterium]|nr:FkbM family methyltransferase [Chitinophagaceae bacterium]